MFAELLSALATVALWVWLTVARPSVVRCPNGWWIPEGARPSGEFECRPGVVGGDDDAVTGLDTAMQPDGRLRLRVYCTGGSRPIVDADGVMVGCSR